jgi:hypothetical protein
VALHELRPHPRNYRQHPPDQLEHIKASITEHGIYRNIVIAREGTILAGHGVVQALGEMGVAQVPVIRLAIDPDSPAALKVLAGDNGIPHLGVVDDRAFTELLKDIGELDTLLGTGYDEAMLANLIFVTRAEIADHQESAAWAEAGMPDYENGKLPFKLIVSFRSPEDREQFCAVSNLKVQQKGQTVTAPWVTWWPYREAEDLASLRFERSNACE